MPTLVRGALSAIVATALAHGLWALASAQAAVGIALGLALGVARPHLARHVRERTWDRLGGGAALLLELGGITWALAFDSMQPSDFGVSWRCGTESAGSLAAQLGPCQSRSVAPTPLFWLRSLLSTRPLGLLLGVRPQAVDVPRALLHAVALGLLLVVVGPALAVLFIRAAPAWDLVLPRGALAVGAALVLGAAWLAQRQPPSLTEARLVDAVDCGGAASLSGAAQRLRVDLPSGVRCAELRVPLGRPARRARLVVTLATFPSPFEPRSGPGLAWAVELVDARARGEFGSQSARFVSLSSPGDALRWRVTRTDATTPATLDLVHLQPA